MNICIYGASSAQLEQIYYDKTEELGKMMAKRGHGLVFGGGATGMMGSAARGVDVEGEIQHRGSFGQRAQVAAGGEDPHHRRHQRGTAAPPGRAAA